MSNPHHTSAGTSYSGWLIFGGVIVILLVAAFAGDWLLDDRSVELPTAFSSAGSEAPSRPRSPRASEEEARADEQKLMARSLESVLWMRERDRNGAQDPAASDITFYYAPQGASAEGAHSAQVILDLRSQELEGLDGYVFNWDREENTSKSHIVEASFDDWKLRSGLALDAGGLEAFLDW